MVGILPRIPDFELPDQDGRPVRLSDLRSGDQP
jgi:peroxiredoxin